MTYRIGDWEAHPNSLRLMSNGTDVKLSPRSMNVLIYLAEHAGQTATHEELIAEFWHGAISSPNAVHKCVAELRHAFGNGDAERVAYIETVPKRGYRLVAPVEALTSANSGDAQINGEPAANGESAVQGSVPVSQTTTSTPTVRTRWLLATGFSAALAVAWTLSQMHSIDTDVITLADRSAAILPAQADLSSIDRHTFDTIREKVLQAFRTSGAQVQPRHRTRGPFSALNDAADWNVDYTVQIELTHANDHLGGSLEIVPANSNEPSRREQLEAPDRAELADQLVKHASEDLAVLLDRAQVAEMQDWGTSNVDAYRYAREGDSFRRNTTVESLMRAAEQYRRAIGEDPTFPYGYVALSMAYESMAFSPNGTIAFETARRHMQELLREASLQGLSADVTADIARSYDAMSATNAYDAEVLWRTALLKDPEDIWALRMYARLLVGAKLVAESEQYIARALTLAPENSRRSVESEYATTREAAGDFEGAIRWMKQTVERNDFTPSLYGLVRDLARLGRFAEAESYLARLSSTDASWAHAAELQLQVQRGEMPKGSAALERAFANPLTHNVSRGMVSFMLGDVDAGVRYWHQIEPAYLRMLWQGALSGGQPFWAKGVVEDPRYQVLLDELGIGAKWRAYMRAKAQELAPVTGIEVTTPASPMEVAARVL